MKLSIAIKCIAVLAVFTPATTVFAHIVLDEPAALAGRSYKAAFKVGHGCDGASTTAIRIQIPAGFTDAKPMPKAGWVLSAQVSPLAVPYANHGKKVTEDVSAVTWTSASKDNWLPDAYYEEFVMRGGLPETGGAMWFKVLQTCDKGSIDWSQIPATGTDTKGLKAPAALLEIIPSGSAGHQH